METHPPIANVPGMPDVPGAFETERLLIRMPLPGDGREMRAAILETWDELHAWMPWATVPPTLREAEIRTRQAHEAYLDRSNLRLHLYLKGTDTLVGASGMHRIDWSVPKFEIGYWCRKRFVGQGYITEAVRGITEVAFDQLGAQRVEIRCDTRNERSRRVAERAGYRVEGVLRNDLRTHLGELRDTMMFALVPRDRARESEDAEG